MAAAAAIGNMAKQFQDEPDDLTKAVFEPMHFDSKGNPAKATEGPVSKRLKFDNRGNLVK